MEGDPSRWVAGVDRRAKKVDGVPAPICSLADLVTLKRAAGRERDLADLSDLEAAHGELPTGGS
jgi:hypothetical protein